MTDTEPLDGYDQMDAGDVVARLEGLSDEDVARVQAYEAEHKDRVTVTGWTRPAPPEPPADDDGEPFQPEGRPTLADVAEQAAADETVHDLTTQED